MIGLRPVGEEGLVIGVGAKAPAPAVATVMVKGATAPFATATLGGTVHVAPNGTPEHVNVRAPLKPVPGVAVKLYCAVCPAFTEAAVLPPLGGAMFAAGVAV